MLVHNLGHCKNRPVSRASFTLHPNLAPSDFYLFGPIKDNLNDCIFNGFDSVKIALKSWIQKQNPEFFQNAFDAWVKRLRKYIHGRRQFRHWTTITSAVISLLLMFLRYIRHYLFTHSSIINMDLAFWISLFYVKEITLFLSLFF